MITSLLELLITAKNVNNVFSLISLKMKILENFDFVFLEEVTLRFISSTDFFQSDIRGLRCTGLKKVNFVVGHLVPLIFGQNWWSNS